MLNLDLQTILIAILFIVGASTSLFAVIRWTAALDLIAAYALVGLIMAFLVAACIHEGRPGMAAFLTAGYLLSSLVLAWDYAREHARRRLALAA